MPRAVVLPTPAYLACFERLHPAGMFCQRNLESCPCAGLRLQLSGQGCTGRRVGNRGQLKKRSL